MPEKLTDWQMIAGLYRKVAESTDISGQAVDLAVGTKLAFMVKEGAEVIAETNGEAKATDDGYNYQLAIGRHDGNHYFIVFPDIATAVVMGRPYIKCKIEELLRLIYNTPQMKGIQLVIDYDKETGKFETGEITKNMAVIALGI